VPIEQRSQPPKTALIIRGKVPLKVVVLLSWVSRGGGTNLAFEVIEVIRRRGMTVVPVVVQLKPGEGLPDPSWRCLAFAGDYRNPLRSR
jgi:hypothetical protein